MAIQISDNIASARRTANLDAKFGPYTSRQDVIDHLVADGSDIQAVNGLTVGVFEDNNVVEYVFKNVPSNPTAANVTVNNLFLKQVAVQEETDPTVPAWAKQETKPSYTASEVGAIPSSEKGANNGVATLGSDGKVPQSQLPSYVDDVLEYSNQSSFPVTGESGKIYVALDTNKTYRWSGSAYVEISQSLALGETSSTAFAGDRGKAIEDKIPSNASSSNKLVTASDLSGKVDKVANAQENNFASFDSNGGIKDSLCNEGTFIKGVKQNGTTIDPENGVVNVTVQDGTNGQSAYEIWLEENGYTSEDYSEEDFLNSLKAQIGAFVYQAYDANTGVTNIGDVVVGSGNNGHINSLAPSQDTLDKIVLMPNNDSVLGSGDPTATMMFSTNEVTGTPPTFQFVYIGNVNIDASVFVLKSNIDNDFSGGSGKVAGADEVKTIVETTMELVESKNLINPAPASEGGDIYTGYRLNTSGVLKEKGTYTQVYGVTDYVEIGDGIVCTHCTRISGSAVVAACIYDNNKVFIGSLDVLNNGDYCAVTKNITPVGTSAEGSDPTNPTYARFSLYNPEYAESGVPYNGVTDGYAVYKGTILPAEFVQYFAPHWKQKEVEIRDNSITTQKIADAAVTIDKMADTVEKYASDNILNPDTCVFEFKKYISFNNGGIGTSGSSTTKANGYTDYIPIDSRGIVFNHGVVSGSSIGAAVYYLDGQGNKVFKRGNLGYNNSTDQVIVVNYDAGDLTLPDSNPLHYPDAFVRFTISNAGDANNVMCNIGTVLKDYVPYGGIKKTLSPEILPNNETDIDSILQQEKIFTDALKVALPDKFYAVRGDVLQLFHKGVVYAIDFANRYAMPTCSKGTQYRRYYELDTTKVVFVVSSSASITVGDVYSTQGNTYEVTKVATEVNTKSVTCTFKGSTTITSSGTLTKVSGNGDSSIAYTKFTDTVAAGEYPYTLTVYDDNRNILGNGSSIIKLVNFPTAPQSTKRILCIGASTTAGGQWVCEAQRRLLGTGVNPTYPNSPKGDGLDATKIKFIGGGSPSMTKTLYGQTASFFAKSGWAWQDFATKGRYAIRFYLDGVGNSTTIGNKYTNNGHTYEVIELNTIDDVETIRCSTSEGNLPSPHGDNVNGTLVLSSGDGDATLTYIKSEVDGANPFWNSTLETPALDFQNYVENTCGETGLDMMIVVLGANGLFAMSLEQQEEYVRTFVEACHADYPDCKIILVGSSSPSMINMMPGYAVGGSSYGNTYLAKCRLLDIFEMYKTIAADYEYVEYESWAGQFDSDYNYPLSQKAVNTRNDSVTEPFANNTLHPSDTGYMQFADAAYRSIVAHLCQ